MKRTLAASEGIQPGPGRGGTEKVAILVDTREAARMLAISPRTLWQLTKLHVLPSVKIGRSVRYRVADLDEWAKQRSTGA